MKTVIFGLTLLSLTGGAQAADYWCVSRGPDKLVLLEDKGGSPEAQVLLKSGSVLHLQGEVLSHKFGLKEYALSDGSGQEAVLQISTSPGLPCGRGSCDLFSLPKATLHFQGETLSFLQCHGI
jgi:hypothetical protein